LVGELTLGLGATFVCLNVGAGGWATNIPIFGRFYDFEDGNFADIVFFGNYALLFLSFHEISNAFFNVISTILMVVFFGAFIIFPPLWTNLTPL